MTDRQTTHMEQCMCVAIIGIACSGSDFTEKTVTINLVFNLPINKQLCQCQLRTLGTVRVGQRKKHLTAQIYFTDAQKNNLSPSNW